MGSHQQLRIEYSLIACVILFLFFNSQLNILFTIISLLCVFNLTMFVEIPLSSFLKDILQEHAVHERNARFFVRFANSLRSTDQHGLWCVFLLLLVAVTDSRNCSHNFASFIAIWTAPLLVSTLLAPVCAKNRKILAAVMISTAVFANFTGALLLSLTEEWLVQLFILIATFVIFYAVWLSLLLLAENTFTLGESSLLAQGVTLVLYKSLLSSEPFLPHLQPVMAHCVRAAIGATVYIITSTVVCRRCRKTTILCYLNIFAALFGAVFVVSTRSEVNLVSFGWRYLISGGKSRWCLLLFWALCNCASVIFVGLASTSGEKLNTGHRKFFHLTVGLVGFSGLQLEPELTLFASAVVACAFLFVELIRLLRLRPFGPMLYDSFQSFIDAQDSGALILTPLYLLASIFLPLWLCPVTSVSHVTLKHFAGLVAIGIGDSFASVFGYHLGRCKWGFGVERKTVEGTVAAIFAQFFGLLVIIYVIRLWTAAHFGVILNIGVVCVLSALLETFTYQIDNLVLPLISYVMLSSF